MRFIGKKAILFFLVVFFTAFIYGCSKENGRTKRGLTVLERQARERTDDGELEDFIDSLMLRMTLAEKIGQMIQLDEALFYKAEKSASDTFLAMLIDTAHLRNMVDSLQFGSVQLGKSRSGIDWFRTTTLIQETNLKYGGNAVPLIFSITHNHGTGFLSEGSVFPHQLNIGASFNIQFAREMGFYTAFEAVPLGHHLNFAPTVEVGKKSNSPALYETFGEDIFLASTMGAAYIEGLQGKSDGDLKMAACAKFFLGHDLTNSGWQGTPVDISTQRINEMLLPPFKSAIEEGVLSIMVNPGDINGIPVHASREYLTGILRDDLGFNGVAITRSEGLLELKDKYFVADTEKEAIFQAIQAGLDVVILDSIGSIVDNLRALIEEGRISEERLDLSVKRVLRMKYQLGLFKNPLPDPNFISYLRSAHAEQSAINAAGESIVLMKNEKDLLPLKKVSTLVVVGSNADDPAALYGGWSQNEQGIDGLSTYGGIASVYEALTDELDGSRVIYSAADRLNNVAQHADAILVITGEKPYAGEVGNVLDMELPGDDQHLIDLALKTGKPVIIVLLEGRPRMIADFYDRVGAVLFAGLPGKYGGRAISGIISGRINPSAKMPVTYPLSQSFMINYDHKPNELIDEKGEGDDPVKFAICEFGSGESYSDFVYSDLVLSDTVIYRGGTLEARLKVQNISQREGKEAVLWFLSDESASITRPVKQLKYFEKKFLLPGEVKEFSFTIDPIKHLSYFNEDGEAILEEGYFTLNTGFLSTRFFLSLNE